MFYFGFFVIGVGVNVFNDFDVSMGIVESVVFVVFNGNRFFSGFVEVF